jgi:parvulin-like peptidyl-prolyl isomerase
MRDTLGRTGDELPNDLGDPLPGLSTERTATSEEVRMEYGPALADALTEGLVGVWRGPIPSVYGVHFINVREVAPSYVPPLDDIAPEVREHYLRGVREELRVRRMNELLDAYTVNVERLP